MKVTFAHWANYTICIKTFLEKIGLEVIVPEKTNKRTIEEGAKLSPELYCFPLKINVGNYLSALKKGADTIFMWDNIDGICRFRYYWIVQQKILNEAGFKVKIINLNKKNFISRLRDIKKRTKISWYRILESFYFLLKEFRFVEYLEKKATYFRPREKIVGQTDEVLNEVLEKLEEVKKIKNLRKIKKQAKATFSKIELKENCNPPKIGFIGEIYMVVDNIANFDLEKKLGQMGLEVHREMRISYFLKHSIFPWLNWSMRKKIKHYLKSTVGGHGIDAVKEMLDSVKKKFDGVIHVLPFGCMPETTIRPILQKIHQKTNIPFLSLSLDEQTGEAGIQTRAEAFVDVVKNYHNKKIRN